MGGVRRELLARTGLLLVVAVGGMWAFASGSADAAAPRMTLTGTVNALGVLTTLELSPSEVAVPPGGEVRFVNRSGGPLALQVDGVIVKLPNDKGRLVRFAGSPRARVASASATAANLPGVGSLTSSIGAVKVGALPVGYAPPKQSPSAAAPAPADPVPGATAQGTPRRGLATPGSVPPPAQPGEQQPPAQPGQQQPPGPVPAPVPGRAVGQGRASAVPAVTGIEPAEQNSPDDRPAPLDGTVIGDAIDEPPADTTVTTVSDGRSIGLIILVATLLLGGIGTAAIRSVVSVRSARFN